MNVQLMHSVAEMRQALSAVRRSGTVVGLVPTMGALHAGHGRLIEAAAGECGYVVVSIFVNPIQFNDQQDYARYPQTLSTDIEFCQARGAHAVFAPSAAEMYPHPQSSFVEVTGVSERLCGEFRPGHFRGVATVVLKLFSIVQPERAYFGEKDAQQLAVIQRMVRDLNVPVQVVGVPTVREPDGLALSSRNQRLSQEERRIAPALYRALELAARRIAMGERRPEKVRLGSPGGVGEAGNPRRVFRDRRPGRDAAGRSHRGPGAGGRGRLDRVHPADRQYRLLTAARRIGVAALDELKGVTCSC